MATAHNLIAASAETITALNAEAIRLRDNGFSDHGALERVITLQKMVQIKGNDQVELYRLPDGTHVNCWIDAPEAGIGDGGLGFDDQINLAMDDDEDAEDDDSEDEDMDEEDYDEDDDEYGEPGDDYDDEDEADEEEVAGPMPRPVRQGWGTVAGGGYVNPARPIGSDPMTGTHSSFDNNPLY